MSEKEEWQINEAKSIDVGAVLHGKYILALDRAHKAEEKLAYIIATMNTVVGAPADLDAFYQNVFNTWTDLKIKYFPHTLTAEEKLEAIRKHLQAPDVGSNPWIYALHDLVNIGATKVNAAPSVEQANSPSLDT